MEIHVLGHLAIHTEKRTINFRSSLDLCVNTKAARLPDERKYPYNHGLGKDALN